MRESQLSAEKEKLALNNKVHNSSDMNLKPDLIKLLNKGTNFLEKTNIFTIRKTISSEVNSALCKIHHGYQTYPQGNAIELLTEQIKPNLKLHIIDYIQNTTSNLKHYLQPTNLQNIFKLQHLNITQSYISATTLSLQRQI